MSLNCDLVWKNLDLVYRSSISYQFARYALGLNYEALPQDVGHQAKRCVLDALGCAAGAYYTAPGRSICEAVAQETGGPQEAVLFGSGWRSSVENATMVNCFLVRFLDCNDLGGGGHNSEAIPPLLALAEREKASGRDFLTSVVISYELGARVSQSLKSQNPAVTSRSGHTWMAKGWTPEVRAGLNMPPALGKLMGLTEDQIANAIGISASHSLPLTILDTDKEENTMTKNLRFGFGARDAMLACRLAAKGFTGPIRIVEGEGGIRQVILQGEMDLESLTDFSGWKILLTRFKSLCLNAASHGHVSCTLAIVKENDLKPEDIASVQIKCAIDEWSHTTALCKKYPRNAETADHSSFYVNAIAIKERGCGPESFEPEKLNDPVVLDLIEKITIEPDRSLPPKGAISEITTRDGRRFQKRIDNPHGFGDDPLSDAELEAKFRQMAARCMGEPQIQKIFDVVWNLENVERLDDLTSLMVFHPAMTGLR